jgi:septal ring factor EnvC (AmiA/AmiB activator)
MKLGSVRLLLSLALMGAALYVSGCGEAPPCQTNLVTLDETRLDAETYEQEAAETGKNAADLEKKLAQKKSDIEQVKDKPAELKKKVNEVKKGSGRE